MEKTGYLTEVLESGIVKYQDFGRRRDKISRQRE